MCWIILWDRECLDFPLRVLPNQDAIPSPNTSCSCCLCFISLQQPLKPLNSAKRSESKDRLKTSVHRTILLPSVVLLDDNPPLPLNFVLHGVSFCRTCICCFISSWDSNVTLSSTPRRVIRVIHKHGRAILAHEWIMIWVYHVYIVLLHDTLLECGLLMLFANFMHGVISWAWSGLSMFFPWPLSHVL